MQREDRNYGIAIIKIFLSFAVVCCHFWAKASSNIFATILDLLRGLAVPCFALISFYYFAEAVQTRDIAKMKKRVTRLFIPYFGWAIIYFAVYSAGLRLFELNYSISVTFKDLAWQLLFGSSHVLNPVLWYIWDTIMISYVVFLVYFILPKERAVAVMACLTFFAVIMQYTQLNYRIFGNLPYESRYTLGRFLEIFPYASVGIMLYNYDMESRSKKMSWRGQIIIFVTFLFAGLLPVFQPMEKSFGYSGIQSILMSTLLVIGGMSISTIRLPDRAKGVLFVFEKNSLGIYCMHMAAGVVTGSFMRRFGIEISSIIYCMLIWIVCLIVSWVISKIPINAVKRLVN